MYRLFLGSISALSQTALPAALAAQAPAGPRHSAWIAGRALLSRAVSPLPPIHYGEQGKPEFEKARGPWFNLSHSGDEIILLLSDEGPVGCDIERLRPHPTWQQLANAVFTVGEHALMEQAADAGRLDLFWQIWTRKEAMVKQRGGSVWQIVAMDSSAPRGCHLSSLLHEGVSLAACTATPLALTPSLIEIVEP
ncbi:4'-phosphopantetheinyl transferase AcpT [Pluralibacter gergoviae]|uniref:4'-phosphopantetheinyl transferase AcpT n=1 Tax=Pluralibacter gergoviae TaxID=61647 RepID=UPI00288123CF|nr:4'-phosphopantetheinyl transferase AcpT [Pluralibacter gergoviae]ELK5592293.1 4'-phosphopantetheinyl transferase AcpT [Pluralibacter gergoviae]MDU4431276.1 4'-phosphopantetheinyl transferase AcpT [Pluralibacter gergoviae]